MKRICVIGAGHWGSNHIKTLCAMGCLAAIVESSRERLSELHNLYSGVECYSDVDQAIAYGYDGYTIATPAPTHYDIARKIISKGANVMIEKPMTLSSKESHELCEMAKKSGSRVMVGHVLLFHPAYRKIKECIDEGKLGKLNYLYSNRLNLGTVRTEESVFSSFAPHDISILDYLVGAHSIKVEAKGAKFLQDKVYDTTMTQLEYPDNVHAHIFVSWLHPFKQQLLVVVGSRGMISFDDATSEKEIHFYNKHIDFQNGRPLKVEAPDEIIPYERRQPLEQELRYFVDHLEGKIEVNTCEAGYEVVKVLESVEHFIQDNGK